ncbi:MAG: PIN domain-containing protein [Candidatus Marsarchaeota archaeon]|nr:PIN domain-containing protein [Candidatus Marsarchaeota archaeon]
MRLVLDANILFSAALKNSRTRKLMLDERLTLYAPMFLKDEVLKHRVYLAKKARTSERELARFVEELLDLAEVEFIDLRRLGAYMDIASRITPDPKDIPYIALALFEGCELWSNDRRLREDQSVVKVLTTSTLQENIH